MVDVISVERFGVDSVVPFVGTSTIVLESSVSQLLIMGVGEVGGCSVIN